jgi:hypothetical protein
MMLRPVVGVFCGECKHIRRTHTCAMSHLDHTAAYVVIVPLPLK